MPGAAAVMAALLLMPGTASAGPDAPRDDAACDAGAAGAMAWPAGVAAPLLCDRGRWEPVADPYPVSDRWVSNGPTTPLRGQGRRNPSLLSGEWTATPLSADTRCSATQLAVVPNQPAVGPPQTDRGEPGQPLSLEVVPSLVTVELDGDCLWQRTAD